MPIKELIKGNRLEDILDGGRSGIVCGYRLHAGPAGTETEDTSFCGDSRVLEFYTKDYTKLEKHPQGVCEVNRAWDAWLLTCEAADKSDTTAGPELVCYPKDQGQPVPDLPAQISAKQEPADAAKTPLAKEGRSSTGKAKKGKKS